MTQYLQDFDKKRVRAVKSLRVQRSLGLTVTPQARGEAVSVRPNAEMLGVLRSFFPDANNLFRGLRVAEWVNPESIRAKLELTWRPRIADDERVPLLDDLARTLPESDSDDYLITLQDGTKLKRDDLKKSKSFSIPHIGVMPEFDALYDKMVSWLDTTRDETQQDN